MSSIYGRLLAMSKETAVATRQFYSYAQPSNDLFVSVFERESYEL
jgi:hypothetical protein